MILKRFYDENLAQASYLIGCSATGEALVVDPNREIAPYLEAASREGLRITHVTETHIHADFLSGLRELCAHTGAVPHLSREGGADWQYAFAGSDHAVLIGEGDSFMVGNIRIDAMHTPGHTPEHLTFLVTDTAGADRPMGALTGDFIFAGDVGRPDLLEKAAGLKDTMDRAARQLFASLQRFREYPDYLQLWPGHGAGSACGKALGAVPQTTLGYERLFNWAFLHTDENEFVAEVLSGQPEPPRYFAEMKRRNRQGPPLLRAMPKPRALPPGDLVPAIDAKRLVIDTRPWKDYAREHVPGAINIPLNKSFTTWAGWLVPYDTEFFLIVNDDTSAQRALRDLAMIGLDQVGGEFYNDAMAAARAAARTSSSMETDVKSMSGELSSSSVVVLDVRTTQEWNEAHVPTGQGAVVIHIPLGYLEERIGGIPAGSRILVHCKAGARSAIATSILERHGFQTAENVRGGFDAWRAEDLPYDISTAAAAGAGAQ
jgi:hydroxyacylglutathione hydrolase